MQETRGQRGLKANRDRFTSRKDSREKSCLAISKSERDARETRYSTPVWKSETTISRVVVIVVVDVAVAKATKEASRRDATNDDATRNERLVDVVAVVYFASPFSFFPFCLFPLTLDSTFPRGYYLRENLAIRRDSRQWKRITGTEKHELVSRLILEKKTDTQLSWERLEFTLTIVPSFLLPSSTFHRQIQLLLVHLYYIPFF